MTIDILVPIARVVDIVHAPVNVPWDLRGEVSGYLRGRQEVSDWAHAIGRAKAPRRPVVLYGPDDYMPIVVVGEMESAEIEDRAHEAIDKQEESMKKNGRGMDFEDAREQRGLVRREDFGTALAEGFARRARYLKAHRRTDPTGKEDDPNAKTQF